MEQDRQKKRLIHTDNMTDTPRTSLNVIQEKRD